MTPRNALLCSLLIVYNWVMYFKSNDGKDDEERMEEDPAWEIGAMAKSQITSLYRKHSDQKPKPNFISNRFFHPLGGAAVFLE